MTTYARYSHDGYRRFYVSNDGFVTGFQNTNVDAYSQILDPSDGIAAGLIIFDQFNWLAISWPSPSFSNKLRVTSTAGAQWQDLLTFSVRINSLAYHGASNTLAIATNDGVYVSTDRGNTATLVPGTGSYAVEQVVFDQLGGFYFVQSNVSNKGAAYVSPDLSTVTWSMNSLGPTTAETQKCNLRHFVANGQQIIIYQRSAGNMGLWSRTDGIISSFYGYRDNNSLFAIHNTWVIGNRIYYTMQSSVDFKIRYFELTEAITWTNQSSLLQTANSSIAINPTKSNFASFQVGSSYTYYTAPRNIVFTGEKYIMPIFRSVTNPISGNHKDYYVQSTDGQTWEYVEGPTNLQIQSFIQPETNFVYVTNTAPTNIGLSTSSIVESASIGTTIGTLSATDAEGGAMTFSLVSGTGSTDNASFSIVGNELRTNVALDYEAKSSYSIRIKATDSGSLSFEKQFTIYVTNVNEAPTSISLSASSIQEGNAVNAVIGTLSAIEADVGDSVIFSVVSGADKFNISGTQLRASVVFDRDTATSHSVTVRATDQGGLSLDQSFTISVLNSAPTSVSLSNSSISESASSQATVGTLSAVDPGGGSCSFSLVSGTGSVDNDSFQISGTQLKLASGVSFDYEAKSSYSIRVQATDAHGASVAQAFTISILNANEMPSSISLSASSIMENNALNAVIGTLSAVDPDVGDSVSFSIVSGSDKFNLSGNQLRASMSFDRESATSHSVTVRGTDAGGLFRDQSFTILVLNDVSDDPVALVSSEIPVLASGKAVAELAVDPRVAPVTLGGQALPEGSVVRNTVTGQKFMKSSGGVTAFVAIELEPKAQWSWSASADAAWEVLQGF